MAQFVVGNFAIEVFIKGHHQLIHLFLGDCEAHSLKHIMELVDFNEAILVFINLVEAISESQTSLNKNFHQVIEDFILCVFH